MSNSDCLQNFRARLWLEDLSAVSDDLRRLADWLAVRVPNLDDDADGEAIALADDAAEIADLAGDLAEELLRLVAEVAP